MSEISIYKYLSKDESNELVKRLKKLGIPAYSRGMASENLDINQVIIDDRDLEKAQGVVDEYKKALSSKVLHEKFKCPGCKAQLPNIGYKQDLSFLKKLLSVGTKVLKCKKCGHEWYI